jgi:hypothetical protein
MSDIAPIITAAAALVALIGGYIQFVLRRAIHPCIEFDVEFSTLNHPAPDQAVGEVICLIRNEGPGVGYVTNVRCRIRYRLAGESGKAGGTSQILHIDFRLKDSFALIQKIVSFSRESRSGIASRLRSSRIHA